MNVPELLCQASCHPAVRFVFCGLLSSEIRKKKYICIKKKKNKNQFAICEQKFKKKKKKKKRDLPK